MENWEDILAGYLEGLESRADAEALRWKIHLAAEVREEVEAVLRLADEVAAAIGSVAVPEGAFSRLQESLHGQPDWTSRAVPAGWWHEQGDSATPSSREDAINEMIEGTVPAGAVALASVAGGSAKSDSAETNGADEELAGRLEQVQVLAAGLSELARRRPPEGAVDRMLSRFREDVGVGESTAEDDEAARQFLDRLRTGAPRRATLPAHPDVLAASAEPTETPEPEGPADEQ